MKSRIIAFVPLPPPYAGPEIATQSLLDVLPSAGNWEWRVVKANVRSSNDRKGNFDLEGVIQTGKSLLNLFFHCFRFRPQKVYLLLNPSKAGFLRDAAAILIAKLFFCKVIGHYHGSHFQYFYKNSPFWYRFLIRKVLNRLDRVLVQAERLKSVFSGLYPDSKLSVLYNGIPDGCLARGQRAVDLRKRKNSEEVTFLFLGHLSFTKGFYELMMACRQFASQGRRIRLLVAGDFILNPKTQVEFLEEPTRHFYQDRHAVIHREMTDFVENNQVSGVEYRGIVRGEEKFLLFEQADVFILPSYTEGFPNVVLEAMAFGCALIVTPVGALPEFLREGVNAFFVARGSVDSLMQQIDRCRAQPSLCFQMGLANRKLVEKYRMPLVGKRFSGLISNSLK